MRWGEPQRPTTKRVPIREPGPWYSVTNPVKPFSLNEELDWHRMKRHEVVKEWRSTFFWLAKQAQIPHLDCIEVEVIAYGVKFDCGNVAGCAKAAIDGLVDARVIPDDNPRHLVGIMFRPNRLGKPALELRFREVGSGLDQQG